MPAPIEKDLLTEPEKLSESDQLIREIVGELAGIEAEYQRLDERSRHWKLAAFRAGFTDGELRQWRRARVPVYEP